MKTLEQLLRMTVPVGEGCISPPGTPMTPRFIVSVQKVRDDDPDVHFIIHADGYDSDTLDFTVRGNELIPLRLDDRIIALVARAIERKANNGGSTLPGTWDMHPESVRQGWRDLAEVAIETYERGMSEQTQPDAPDSITEQQSAFDRPSLRVRLKKLRVTRNRSIIDAEAEIRRLRNVLLRVDEQHDDAESEITALTRRVEELEAFVRRLECACDSYNGYKCSRCSVLSRSAAQTGNGR